MNDHIRKLKSTVLDSCRLSTVCVGRLGVGCRDANDCKQSWVFPSQFDVSFCSLFRLYLTVCRFLLHLFLTAAF